MRASQPGGRRRSIAEQAAETEKAASGAPPTSDKRRAERRSSGVFFAPLPAGDASKDAEAKDELYDKASLAFERLRMNSVKFFVAAARYLPEEGEDNEEDEEDEQQERAQMLPPDKSTKSNKVQDKVLRAKEICECLSHLTALDIKPDSSAAKALMQELDPEGTGVVTVHQMRENFPEKWEDAAVGVPEEYVIRSQSMPVSQRRLSTEAGEGNSGGWGRRKSRRPSQTGWVDTLEQDNAVGWGKNGYAPYTPTAINIQVTNKHGVSHRRTQRTL